VTPERAKEILYAADYGSKASIMRASAHVMMQHHPDTCDDPETELTMGEIKQARECLLSLIGDAEIPCKMCSGRGLIRWSTCRSCKGTGAQR
jgi:DnaJ-class molecular chaperone